MDKNKDQARSYKDLVRENMRINAELRKIGSELNRNHNYSTPKIQEDSHLKTKELSESQIKQLERRKKEELREYKILLALKKHQISEKVDAPVRIRPSKVNDKPLISSTILERKQSKNLISNPQIPLRKLSVAEKAEKHINILRNSNLVQNTIIDPINQKEKEKFAIYRKNKSLEVNSLSIAELKPHTKNENDLLRWIRENIIGFNTTYVSAVHLPIETIYVDHTATNRPFRAVEVLVDHAKLFAANPHTQFSRYGKFSTELMHYARDSLLRSFNAPTGQYIVLPTGGGSTGAIEKTVQLLKCGAGQNTQKPSVFITPYEHHSNILPWVQFYGKVEILAHNKACTLDMKEIYQQLLNCESNTLIVTVSAASNVTSKVTHLKELNQVIKDVRKTEKKRLIFAVDCAAFCCHHDLDLAIYDEIDFAFLSPHKNLGGAESCGVLVARKCSLKCEKPSFPGGGTVRFVKGYTKNDIMYEADPFAREIAGTPPSFGFYRAALSFELLKNVVGYNFIHKREKDNTELFFELIETANAEMKSEGIDMLINIYGERDLEERANVITFNFEYGDFQFVQHSLASLVLTDIFGVQIRSGCFCAGPYGIELLDIKNDMVNTIKDEVQAGIMINKPGYLRLDVTFYLETYEVQYIAKAVILIARYWKNLLKLYTICNGGEVVLLPVFNQHHKEEVYSLSQIEEAHSKLREESDAHHRKITHRKQTLAKQLRVGEHIAKHPLDFLKRMKEGNFTVDKLLQDGH